jgi:phospholipid N-methyltransferase
MGRTKFWLVLLMCCTQFAPGAYAQVAKEPERTGGPYVPTPQVVVDQMLRFANVGAEDFVMDLGSGDGVIVLTAATRLKAKGLGVEIDPELVKLANGEAKKLGVAERANFQVLDVFKADLSRASVVTLYLLPGMMMNLRDKIFNELKPGSRVVSHDYHFGDWQSQDQMTFDVPEKEKINGVPSATLYLWIIPAKIAGRWHIKTDGETHDLTLRQNFNGVTGTPLGGRAISNLTLRGNDISFSVVQGQGRVTYRGRVSGDSMSGTVDLGGGKNARWEAARAATPK